MPPNLLHREDSDQPVKDDINKPPADTASTVESAASISADYGLTLRPSRRARLHHLAPRPVNGFNARLMNSDGVPARALESEPRFVLDPKQVDDWSSSWMNRCDPDQLSDLRRRRAATNPVVCHEEEPGSDEIDKAILACCKADDSTQQVSKAPPSVSFSKDS